MSETSVAVQDSARDHPCADAQVRSPHTLSPAGLVDLLAQVEAAAGPDRALDHELFLELQWTGQGDHRAPPAYTASLDAALALVEQVQPECDPMVWRFDGSWGARLNASFGWRATLGQHSYSPTPALALCAALVRALISAGGAQDASTPGNSGRTS